MGLVQRCLVTINIAPWDTFDTIFHQNVFRYYGQPGYIRYIMIPLSPGLNSGYRILQVFCESDMKGEFCTRVRHRQRERLSNVRIGTGQRRNNKRFGTQHEVGPEIQIHYHLMPAPPSPTPAVWSRLASSGYFSCTCKHLVRCDPRRPTG